MIEKIEINKLGEFFVQNKIITKEQLTEALSLQKDNPEQLIGHVLVTLGAVTKEQLIMAFEAYLITSGLTVTRADEWLDQEEVDAIMNNLRANPRSQ
ncbi:MAG: hypothetical protein FWG13_02395 [Leptospirales bacterium]|nr:hypothetical protein [Leptospirales bacterium]